MDIPHCPNPHCTHFTAPQSTQWYIRYGYHRTTAFGSVPRFRCKHCRRTFSSQTFSLDYYVKKVISYSSLLNQLVSASGLNDMSRQLNVRSESIENRFERLSRCVSAIQGEILERLPMTEDLAADGLESFSFSQYYPNHVNIFAGCASEFIYALGFANLRRKGRMTDAQRKKRERCEAGGKADPKAVEKSFRYLVLQLLEHLHRKGITGKTLFTDEHRAYPRAFSGVKDFPLSLQHRQISAKAPRQKDTPLFPVNYIDRQIRKDLSDHARETVQYARCPSALMARMSVYRFYHNCCIPRRVRESRKGNEETHAERAGISRDELDAIIARHWGKQSFLHKVNPGREELTTWMCGWRNPGVTFGRYIPRYIAA
jgi:transposase-like protein